MSGSSSKETFCRIVLSVAMVILLHAAYSVAEWRSLTRKNDQSEDSSGDLDSHGVGVGGGASENTKLPLDITIQTVVGFVLAMFSVVNIAGDFKEIRAGIEMGKRSWENARNRPSFYVYNHRGKAFSPDYVPPSTGPSAATTNSSSGGGVKKSVLDIPQRFMS